MSTDPEDGTRITGIDVPFLQLVVLLVKLAIAAIPAMIIVSIFWIAIGGFLFSLVGGLGSLRSATSTTDPSYIGEFDARSDSTRPSR